MFIRSTVLLLVVLAAATVSATVCDYYRQYPGHVSISEFDVESPDQNCACLDWTIPPPPNGGGGDVCKWQISKDYDNGSPEGGRDATPQGSGGNAYEIVGMAFKQDATHSYFYVKSGQPLTGKHRNNHASIDYGDLFINFGNKGPGGFDQAKANGDMWGIHFTPDSDFTTSSDPARDARNAQSVPGVYSGINTISVTGENTGWSSIQAYINNRGANTVGFGTKADGTPINPNYFTLNKRVATNIDKRTGNREGGFDYVIFHEDALLPSQTDDCSAYNSQNSLQSNQDPKYRYCANNPQALHHETRVIGQEPVIDPDNICNSPQHPDINCVTPSNSDPFPASWGQFVGSGRDAPLAPIYNFGIRIKNEVFGTHAANGASFRACLQLECGNDIACIDAEFKCDVNAQQGGGGGGL